MPATYLVCIVILGITVVPLLYVFLDGARSTAQISNSSTALPNPWVWSNYGTILSSASFWEFLANSALIAGVATALAVGLGSMAAFALSRYDFRGREVFYGLALGGLAELLEGASTAAAPVAERLATCTRIGPEWV